MIAGTTATTSLMRGPIRIQKETRKKLNPEIEFCDFLLSDTKNSKSKCCNHNSRNNNKCCGNNNPNPKHPKIRARRLRT